MGVPVFFKWLITKFPKILSSVIPEGVCQMDNFTIDNLYLDLNGIIHPCCHPPNLPQPETLEQMLFNIYEYIKRLVKLVKPRKVLYLAIDGVAPRAKMNQQRSRRFKAAFESQRMKVREAKLREEWLNKGLLVPEMKPSFDSNIITPGTKFMSDISQGLKQFIAKMQLEDDNWKGLTIYFNDANVAGEGEHKILEYIKLQRGQKCYDPNTKHCIFGADADLIMLSLITHEPHFYIMRQNLNQNSWKTCEICDETGHTKEECKKYFTLWNETENSKKIFNEELCVLSIPVLKDYLQNEFRPVLDAFKLDIERIIDDFVLICFLVGNDFVPSLPTLKIREGAIDLLLNLYLSNIHEGYMTENGNINLSQLEKLFFKLGQNEMISNAPRKQKFGKKRKETIRTLVWEEFTKQQKYSLEINKSNLFKKVDEFIEKTGQKHKDLREENLSSLLSNFAVIDQKSVEDRFTGALKCLRKIEEEGGGDNEFIDKIRIGQEGWRNRYYQEKFRVDVSKDEEFLEVISRSYIEALVWIYHYYYGGCVSYEWFYPFHYSPLASDIKSISKMSISFENGKNFTPVEQLLSVLPRFSNKVLPDCIREIMDDESSEITDFFPSTTQLDMNGHIYSWMGVNLVPFIEADRIRKVVKSVENRFSPEERERYKDGKVLVYINYKENVLYQHINETQISYVDVSNFTGFYKYICPEKDVFVFEYEGPFARKHRSDLLPGVKMGPTNQLVSFCSSRDSRLSIFDHNYNCTRDLDRKNFHSRFKRKASPFKTEDKSFKKNN